MELKHVIFIGILVITVLLSQATCGLVYGSTLSKIEFQKSEVKYEYNPDKSSYLSAKFSDGNRSTREAEIARIRNATLLIRMQAPKIQNTVRSTLVIGFGIGSLIQLNGEILLVTHNHWGELLQDVSLVEFRNADNQMIIPILGYEFKKWIVYQDAGTIVLRLPKEYIDPSAPINMEAVPQVAAGETVDVVYRENPEREKAASLRAVVEEVITYKGLPAYRLRSLDGQPIKPGDSGGGIWYKGALVGNNWVTVIEKSGSFAETSGTSKDENLSYTGNSIGAILSYDFTGQNDR
jgi:hypothetical protein